MKWVFMTHLHPDHTAGIPSLNSDIGLSFDERELTFPVRATFYGSHMKDIDEFQVFKFESRKVMEPVNEVIDAFGDGSLIAISTPGHTIGHTSYLVNAMEGPILVTGDAAPFMWMLEQASPNAIDVYQELAIETRKKLSAFFLEAYPQMRLYLGHDLGHDREPHVHSRADLHSHPHHH